jgi:hypothetical protein
MESGIIYLTATGCAYLERRFPHSTSSGYLYMHKTYNKKVIGGVDGGVRDQLFITYQRDRG